MIFLVDGSNVLGRAGRDRLDPEEKRRLLQPLASLGRNARAKVVCFFDGARPNAFATSLGGLQVVFSGDGSADDLIVERSRAAAQGEPVRVVTSDQALAARVRARNVEIVRADELLSMLDAAPSHRDTGTDWDAYFSDPKNRDIF